jgi:periplasmic divalent cation tolerance protein
MSAERSRGVVQIQVAHDDRDALQEMIEALVGERLIACGQIVGPVSSTYEWEGETQRAQQEWLALLKTGAAAADGLVRRIAELHSYDVPEIVTVELTGGHGPYLEWVAAQTTR